MSEWRAHRDANAVREAAASLTTSSQSDTDPTYRTLSMVDDQEFTRSERETDRLMRMRPQPGGKGGLQ